MRLSAAAVAHYAAFVNSDSAAAPVVDSDSAAAPVVDSDSAAAPVVDSDSAPDADSERTFRATLSSVVLPCGHDLMLLGRTHVGVGRHIQ